MKEWFEPAIVLWWSLILPAALQATPIFLLAASLDLLLPRLMAPRLRAGLWMVAAAKLLLPMPWVSSWGILPRAELPTIVFAEGLAPAWAWWVPCVWLAGSVGLAVGSRWWLSRHVARWKCEATSNAEGMRERLSSAASLVGIGTPRLLTTHAVRGPLVFGLIRPTIVWPADLDRNLSLREQEQVLRHELAHLRRRDGWREVGWFAVLMLFWFHPLVWWAVRRMRAIREQCCDESAAQLPGHCAREYRSALLRVLARMEGMAPTAGLALIDPRTPLTDRLALIEESTPGHQGGRKRVRRWIGLAALGAVAGALPLAGWADQQSTAVAEWIVRPPGSLQLRNLVFERLAEEERK